jgi:DtxR family transcriptional regulator, Mn-dependent transcriptional regulator
MAVDSASSTTEDYVKAIYQLQSEYGAASTSGLAERLHITPASVTGMLKKLAGDAKPLVHYEPYHGATLTASGEHVALELIRHHRLLELFLQQTLGYGWDQVHAEADRLEHVISEEFENRIAALLGEPTEDPHGHPIPNKRGEVKALPCRKLSELAAGAQARVASVSDDEPELLRYAAQIGLVPGAHLKVTERMPFDGLLAVKIESRPAKALGQHIAESVCVAEDREWPERGRTLAMDD